MSEFKPVEIYSNWSHINRLDGKDIEDGEEVEVKWPDGSVQRFSLRLRKGTFPYNDWGHEYTGPDWQAYIEVVYHEVLTKIYLRRMRNILLRRVA